VIGVSLRSLLSHKLRLALTTIAVILGVSFVAGTFILTDTINATFTSIFATANAGVAVTVHGHAIAGDSGGIGGSSNHPIPTSLLATVRAVPGVQDAVGNIFREGATLIGPDGKPIGGNGPPTFGANWITDGNISPYRLRSGKPPVGPDDVVVDAGTAAKHDLVVGQSLPIVFLGGVEEHSPSPESPATAAPTTSRARPSHSSPRPPPSACSTGRTSSTASWSARRAA